MGIQGDEEDEGFEYDEEEEAAEKKKAAKPRPYVTMPDAKKK